MSSLVLIKGLPGGTSKKQIRKFFRHLKLAPESPVTLVNPSPTKWLGEAFVRFAREEDAVAALRYHMSWMGNKYIEVFKASEEDFQATMAREGVCDFSDGVLRCRGLPFTCSAADVASFFSKHGITEDDVTLGVIFCGTSAGEPNGEAWVHFRDESQARRALKERNMKVMGSRYIEVFPASKFDFQQFQNMRRFCGFIGKEGCRDEKSLKSSRQCKQDEYGYTVDTIAQLTSCALNFATKQDFPVCDPPTAMPYLQAEGASPVADWGNHPSSIVPDVGAAWVGLQMPTTMPASGMWHSCLASPAYVDEPSYGMGGSLEKGKLCHLSDAETPSEKHPCLPSPRYVKEPSYCTGGSVEKSKFIEAATQTCQHPLGAS